MGLPLVATDIRGCRQVVDDGVTGTLVPVRDAGAIADAVAATRRRRRRRGRRWARPGAAKAHREFDDRKVIDITLGVYERLLGTPAGGRLRDRAARRRRRRARLAELHATRITEGSCRASGPGSCSRLYRRDRRGRPDVVRATSPTDDGAGPGRRVRRGRDRRRRGSTASFVAARRARAPASSPRRGSSGRGAGCSRPCATRRAERRRPARRRDPRGRGRRAAARARGRAARSSTPRPERAGRPRGRRGEGRRGRRQRRRAPALRAVRVRASRARSKCTRALPSEVLVWNSSSR